MYKSYLIAFFVQVLLGAVAGSIQHENVAAKEALRRSESLSANLNMGLHNQPVTVNPQ